jgi:Putative prokaryotic signal transducing protein
VSELATLTIVPTEAEAELVVALLGTAGIEAIYRQTNAGAGAADGMPQVGAQEVLVEAGDLERAREALAAQPEAS